MFKLLLLATLLFMCLVQTQLRLTAPYGKKKKIFAAVGNNNGVEFGVKEGGGNMQPEQH